MNESIRKQIIEVIETHQRMVVKLRKSSIEKLASAAEAIITSFNQGCRVYICGNGGSAADAQHVASELVGRFEHQRKGLPAIALTTDTSVITSIANDFGYESVFVKQVEALVTEGDIFWAISTSGTSPNIVEATQLAKEKGACILAFTGKTNCKLEQISDICFCADGPTARVQEIHQLGFHIICKLVEQKFCE
ncbi:MAG: D-sedoheptulose-7-phosphate isomerase [Planctomycetota bacterium]|jgi:D-sedoheptulose 7-phosphate isomerase